MHFAFHKIINYIDISLNVTFIIVGKDDINPKDLKNFITSHVNLRFLGLVHSDACYDESFIDSTHDDYRPELVVS